MQGDGRRGDRHDARIWVRLSGEFSVTVEYGIGSSVVVRPHRADRGHGSNDYTAVVTLGGLEPDTEYFYRST